MVAICNVEDNYRKNPKTLGDWVKNVRLKRMEMRRKLRSGGDLRICAILSTALMSAELELRCRQQERFQKWLEFQTKINNNYELQPRKELHHRSQPQSQRGEYEEMVLVSSRQHQDEKKSEEITNLWKCELRELDNFMRSISSSANSSSSNNESDNLVSFCEDDEHNRNKNYQANLSQIQSIRVTS